MSCLLITVGSVACFLFPNVAVFLSVVIERAGGRWRNGSHMFEYYCSLTLRVCACVLSEWVCVCVSGSALINWSYPLSSGNTRVPTRPLIVIIHLCLFLLLDQTSPAVAVCVHVCECLCVCHLHSPTAHDLASTSLPPLFFPLSRLQQRQRDVNGDAEWKKDGQREKKLQRKYAFCSAWLWPDKLPNRSQWMLRSL